MDGVRVLQMGFAPCFLSYGTSIASCPLSERGRFLAPSPTGRRSGKHVYLPRSGSGLALDAPLRTQRALQIGSGGSSDLEHAPAQV